MEPSESMELDNAQAGALRFTKAVLDDFPAMIFVECAENKMIYCNNAAMANGWEETLGAFSSARDRLLGENPKNLSFEITHKNKWYLISNVESRWVDDKPVKILMASDITYIKQSQAQFMRNATLDAMTGIYNRQAGIDFLSHYIEIFEEDGDPFTICFVDLNDLKFINDNFGHGAGDLFIISVVGIIKKAIRQTDMFTRFGGDEFLLIFPHCLYNVVEMIMNSVTKKLEMHNAAEASESNYSISYGILEINNQLENKELEHIINIVDQRMYDMKYEYRRLKMNAANEPEKAERENERQKESSKGKGLKA